MVLSKIQNTALVALATLFAVTQAAPGARVESRSLCFDYDSQKVRGVNLGGWLVLEPWITPSLFEKGGDAAVDEWSLSQALGSDAAQSLLSQHWNSFITADDFQQMSAAGLNHVRIPVGYWAVVPQSGDPYVQGQLDVLDQAIDWARDAGLKVIVDLHGAPGSQNGFDNSGRRGSINWDNVPEQINITLDAIRELSNRYATQYDVVTSIEALNEPMTVMGDSGVDLSNLQQYYYDTWGRLREVNQDTALTMHDGFQDITSWNGFMGQNSGVWNVMMDTHHYEVFDQGLLSQDTDQHVQTACAYGDKVAATDKWTIVGEWTGALTDCAKYLNGRGVGARWDGSYGSGSSFHGSCDGYFQGEVTSLPDDVRTNIRRFIEAQLDAFESRTGWVYWTWTTEGAPEWDMKRQLAANVFPNPVTERQFPGQC
ncbi:putative glucan 1,3-beta-glucosidase A [Talaromyces atroroseus]|uniref:glucan 1,3-beta-glucosidase n=1 Tax=Talaromyces atroroseus TaxID=1441469 RepID=A0A225AMR1_TALAT|nr:putative glucan 1,3-beta-glucosidase A [Talaromyces atroroseus]OKL59624.1 putative glucan 1,3-beta-glucosidase A [Talaromyces atroroseus]